MLPFQSMPSGKRYFALSDYYYQKFGCRVTKIPLNAGMTCPNIDGTKGVGGCTYCSPSGAGEFAGDIAKPIARQFAEQKLLYQNKWPNSKYIAYFQAHTNTYAPTERLRRLFEQALALPDVVGLSVATRADCLEDETVDYLGSLSRRTELVVELGLQSVFDATGERINRCHDYADFLAGYQKLRAAGVNVCVHLINGLPGETPEMMVESARLLSQLDLHSIKLHLLHILKGTAMEKELLDENFRFLSREEYVKIIVDQLELLPPSVVIARLTGDGDRRMLLGPMWSVRKREVLNEIDKELRRRDSWQGKRFIKK